MRHCLPQSQEILRVQIHFVVSPLKGLSYVIIEASSVFHFDAGYALDDDVFLRVKWRVLVQWMKYGLGVRDVAGPFLGK